MRENMMNAEHKASNEKSREGWDRTFGRCGKHPKYRAIFKPRCDCERCWYLYNLRHPGCDPEEEGQ